MDVKSDPNNHLENFSKNVNMFRDRALQIMVFILFRFTRRLVVTLQAFTWAVTGVERIRRDAARGLNFKQSAHVQEIVWKRKFLDHSVAGMNNFITSHKGFRTPACIFKPNVSLYCMTPKEAVFVEVDETINVYKSKHSIYLYQNQYHHAVNIITLPLASFHKMASDGGNPRVPVTWLSCTSRSGATLLSQMMYRIPGMLVLTEPDAITSLGFLYKNKMLQRGEYTQLLASCVRLLCKPGDFSAVFVKGRASTTSLIEDIYSVFPRFRYLFMYRNSIKSIMSNISLFQQDPSPKAIRFIMDNSMISMFLPFVRSHFYYYNAFLNDKQLPGISPKKLDTASIFTASWAASVALCAELRYKGFPIGSILYEDFMKNPRRSLSMLMQILDIKTEYLGMASEALKVDFNRGATYDSPLESRRVLTAESRQAAENVMRAYGLPKLGERHELAGLLKLE